MIRNNIWKGSTRIKQDEITIHHHHRGAFTTFWKYSSDIYEKSILKHIGKTQTNYHEQEILLILLEIFIDFQIDFSMMYLEEVRCL